MELGAIPKTKNNLRDKPSSDIEDGASDAVSIDILPNEILEYILGFISPYSDLDSCARVSRRWNGCCRRVVSVRTQHFRGHTASGNLQWSHQPVAEEDSAVSISKRYSHCAVYHPDNSCMYVFGGCTSTSSTFNDLWELNLSSRTWRRPLSMGAYPSPKACASMVRYGDSLVLFGGWTHPSLYPLHQSWKLFSELHIYNITENRWTLMTSEHEVRPPAMAGHSASVHGNMMIIFGGLHKQRSVGHYTSSNDLWIYNLDSGDWERKLTGGVLPPLPRYGQSQLYLDSDHLLILGGCGGPNNEYTDIWLLDMTYSPWTWIQMEVRGHEHRARDIWCHPAVRVGEVVVVLGKGKAGPAPATKTGAASAASAGTSQAWNVIPQLRRGMNRGQGSIRQRGSVPAPHHRQSVSSSDSDMDLAVEPIPATSRQSSEAGASSSLRSIDDEDDLRPPPGLNLQVNNLGRPGSSRQAMFKTSVNLTISGPSSAQAAPATVRSSLPASNPVNAPNALIPVKVTPAHAKVLGPAANTGNQDPGVSGPRARELSAAASGSQHSQPGAPGNPEPGPGIAMPQKNRQKMLENRQRQLASLQRMEEKIRNSSKAPQAGGSTSQAGRSGGSNTSRQTSTCPHHRMTTHILDISHAISDHFVTWQPVSPVNSCEAPQESILYSLVLGRTELVMFGGLQKDVSLNGGRGQQNNSETVSNCLFFLNPPPLSTN